MKFGLSQLASVAEIVGATAVVVSLLYVGAQVRDSARAVRSAAVNDANSAVQAWYLNLSNNRDTSENWLDGLLSTEPLDTDDEYQFMMTAQAAFLSFQNSFLLAREGSLDEQIMSSITAALIPVKDLPGIERFWQQRRGYFFPDFASYVDTVLASDASVSPVDIFRQAQGARDDQ